MRISLLFIHCLIAFFSFTQETKGTVKVAKSTLAGLYLYQSESGTRTYIRVFSDSSVMLANNNEDVEYMNYWFDRMARDSNLPKGKMEITDQMIFIEIKIAQSKEDNIILNGLILDSERLQLHRVGEEYDNKDYIFIKQ